MANEDDGRQALLALPPDRTASSAVGLASTCPPEAPSSRAGEAEEYVGALLRQYLSLPGTPDRVRPGDRRCAWSLYRRRVPLATARAALLLTTARRTFRGPDRPPLPPIRALFYFLPVIEELLEQPLEPDYVEYLAYRLRPRMKSNRSP